MCMTVYVFLLAHQLKCIAIHVHVPFGVCYVYMCIPLSFCCFHSVILNPSYLPIKSSQPQTSQASVLVRRSHCCNSMYINVLTVLNLSQVPSVKEIREFPPLMAYEPHNHYDPYLSLTHNLYVYPLSLNYESQKQFAKVRSQSINGCMYSACLCCYCLFVYLFVCLFPIWLTGYDIL